PIDPPIGSRPYRPGTVDVETTDGVATKAIRFRRTMTVDREAGRVWIEAIEASTPGREPQYSGGVFNRRHHVAVGQVAPASGIPIETEAAVTMVDAIQHRPCPHPQVTFAILERREYEIVGETVPSVRRVSVGPKR